MVCRLTIVWLLVFVLFVYSFLLFSFCLFCCCLGEGFRYFFYFLLFFIIIIIICGRLQVRIINNFSLHSYNKHHLNMSNRALPTPPPQHTNTQPRPPAPTTCTSTSLKTPLSLKESSRSGGRVVDMVERDHPSTVYLL